MSTGEVHYSVYNWWRWLVIVVGVLTGFYNIPLALGILIGYFVIARYITPDQDQVGITSEESRIMQELKIFGVLVICYFLPYAYFMRFIGIGRKGHRNFFSHTPGVGSLIRLTYLIMPLIACFLYFKWEFNEISVLLFVGAFLGLSFNDFLHSIYDIWPVNTKGKRVKGLDK